MVLTFESMDGIPKCDHSIESYWEVLFCGAVYYEAFQGGKATSDAALKTGDMGLSKHRQATQLNQMTEPAKYDSDTMSTIDRQRRQGIVYFTNKR